MAVSELPASDRTDAKAVPAQFMRFSAAQRIEHWVLAITFVALTVTGLAEKYYSAPWAEWLILNLGGIEYTRLIHRAFGAIFLLSGAYHVSYVVYNLAVRHARPSMFASLKDFRDVVDTLRYSLGFADGAPKFGRYDYRQKFEYWGIIIGGTIMLLSGFMLAFPLAVTAVFPGQLVAAARVAHGSEAMLAALTIVIWHLYDVILKPGIFPADTTMITGKISRKRMMEEHPLEFKEITGVEAEHGPGEGGGGTPPGC